MKTLRTKLAAAVAPLMMVVPLAFAGCDTQEEPVGGEVVEEEVGVFGDWDADNDGYLTEEEFSGVYDRWDANGDGVVMESEFGLE